MITVFRPVVRSFSHQEARRAAAHARAGGHAIYWRAPRSALLVVPRIDEKDPSDLGYWAMLDVERDRYRREDSGAFAGLCSCVVPRDRLWVVRRRAKRDSVFVGAKRKLELDCLACGACCKDNEVILEPEDTERFASAGRADLTKRPYARRRADGRVVLTLTRSKRCRHLADDNKCGIYPIRPDACSLFPAGSEGCLFSREDLFGPDGLAVD